MDAALAATAVGGASESCGRMAVGGSATAPGSGVGGRPPRIRPSWGVASAAGASASRPARAAGLSAAGAGGVAGAAAGAGALGGVAGGSSGRRRRARGRATEQAGAHASRRAAPRDRPRRRTPAARARRSRAARQGRRDVGDARGRWWVGRPACLGRGRGRGRLRAFTTMRPQALEGAQAPVQARDHDLVVETCLIGHVHPFMCGDGRRAGRPRSARRRSCRCQD
jgi:hypothetical protein